ncbi:Mediator of RNA polymerase II transcription subunit 14 [Cytospora mali]|uniref:Mediator of RNA polymerase II transcription subunit 14 n=1 Tax=Cytospora mali TaxID=578113 RepID=A0A194UQN7_CYTMA|nr:Mediator of RNA polymerase II transcription subunit 14 [Valsa mali var. pyri (nom. inval.)]
MENGAQNGLRTNHDRDLKVNGINGVSIMKREPSPNKLGKSSSAAVVNGGYDTPMDADPPNTQAQAASSAPDQDLKMKNLPPEIAHITQNFIPLPFILHRLAQKSHNDLQAKMEELAKIPIHGGVNGATGTAEDNSEENQNKKANLLHFIQDMHGKWVKALVISEWSRKASQVSRLIDLNVHISEQVGKYDLGLDFMGRIKRDLYGARLPDPDIKTALQVLSTGQAPWMPEFGYIDPPPLTVAEQLKWVSELNTLLSVRLNLEDHDKIPYQFRDYRIDSGRVTFKVKGEFEVDLTIADEDFEKQFWFINFRYNFSPAPQDLPEALMAFVEMKVNEALGIDGLRGCYEFLHEFVLTHKINELRRQALVLSRGRWIENIKIERLNRALSIQYWTTRFTASGPNAGPKSWIIVGINSAKAPPRNSPPGTRPTSYLALRWFRDGKEIKDVEVLADTEKISAEVLLKRIIAKHVEHILSSMYAKLLSKPRFEKRQASVSLRINSEEPSESTLMVQLTHSQRLTLRMNMTTGLFNMQPAARSLISRGEVFLNQRCKNPIEDGVVQIESIRWQSEFDEIIRRGKGSGWHMSRRPVNSDEVKRLHSSREHCQTLWLKREGWSPAWYLVVCLSLAGDTWWLVEVMDDTPPTEAKGNPPKPRSKPLNNQANVRNSAIIEQPTARIKTYNLLPITSANPELSVTFFTDLSALTTGMIAQITDITALRKNKIQYAAKRADNPYFSPRLKIPALYVRLASILPPQSGERKLKQPRGSWAEEFVQIVFRGVRGAAVPSNRRLEVSADVKIVVNDKSKFALIKGNVDHDVIYQPRTGQFRIQLRTEIGKSFIESLTTRLKAIDRLVEFVAAMSSRANTVKCESVTLRKVVFTYGTTGTEQPAAGGQPNQPRWRVVLDLARSEKVDITLEKGNPHIRVQDMLERLVNSPVGFEQLPYWLQVTLPLHRGLDSIEDSWAEVTANNQGDLQILPRALDWLSVHFELPGAPNKPPRKLCLSFKLKSRRGQLWWNMERHRRPDETPKKEEDVFDAALQPVFESRGDGWQGHGKSAVAHPNGKSIEGLLAKVSDAVKVLATGSSPSAPAGSQGAAIVLD